MLNTAPNLKFWYNAVFCRTGMGIFENTGRRKNGRDAALQPSALA